MAWPVFASSSRYARRASFVWRCLLALKIFIEKQTPGDLLTRPPGVLVLSLKIIKNYLQMSLF